MNAPSIVHGMPLAEALPPGRLTLPEFFADVSDAYAEREALVSYADGVRISWTYAETRRQVEAVARGLVALGIGKGNRIGLLMTNRPEWVAMFFGIGLAGGIAVPLSTFSTADELAFLIESSGITVLAMEAKVARNDLLASLLALEPAIGEPSGAELSSERFAFLRRVVVLDHGGLEGPLLSWEALTALGGDIADGRIRARSRGQEPADIGAIFFSSGSTSKPKGIINAHRGIVLQFYRQARLLGVTDADEVRAWTPNGFFWSGNCAQVLGATMTVGGTVVLQSVFEAREAVELMARERVTYPQAWPHQWAQLEGAPNWRSTDLSGLLFFDQGKIAEPHPAITTDWTEPRWCYGSTETFTVSTGFAACSPAEVTCTSHGEPLPGNTVKIVDPESGAVLPLGQLGEIVIKGPTLMLGYLGIPPDETFDDAGFFRTGDSGYLDERGRLFWEGRLSDIIKTGGANVSPLEIDATLVLHPQVEAAKTVGVPHRTLGEIVVSCVLLHEADTIGESALIAFLKTKLSGYKIPRRILILGADEFAYTGSSKIKANALRELVADRLVS